MNDRHIDSCPVEVSDDDALKAIKNNNGYLNITPGAFKEIYRFAYRQAIERLSHLVKAKEIMTREVVFVKPI